jgi:hypothetical protein
LRAEREDTRLGLHGTLGQHGDEVRGQRRVGAKRGVQTQDVIALGRRDAVDVASLSGREAGLCLLERGAIEVTARALGDGRERQECDVVIDRRRRGQLRARRRWHEPDRGGGDQAARPQAQKVCAIPLHHSQLLLDAHLARYCPGAEI